MKTVFLTTLLAIGIASPGVAQAQDDPPKDRRDLREDRRDRRKDRRDARKEAREDRHDGRKEAREERREAAEDRRDDRREAREERRDDHHDARRDRHAYRERFRKLRTRMLVHSFGPRFGPPGTKVTIRGQHFPAGATVTYDGKPVRAKVKPESIVLKIPKGAGDGQIVISGGDRPVVVGGFDTKRKVDRNERKRFRDEREKRARERMAERWKQRAKDRAERRKRYEERERERAESRAERARKRAAELRARWKRAFLASPEAQSELALHAERKARLLHMRNLADLDDREKLSLRIEILIEKEDARHARRMKLLETNYKG